MTDDLDRLCAEKGVELSYISETGEHRTISDEVKRALIATLGEAVERSSSGQPREARCFVPDWLEHGRAWGVTVQLFGVRSNRNQGIGDFEDAARLCEIYGALGADFLGINPVHALFLADGGRTSPYFPSTRQFINPLYIALDRVAGVDLSDRDVASLREGDHVEYDRVALLKRRALETTFAKVGVQPDFDAFCEREGRELENFATFEAISEWSMAQGSGSGWHAWPAPFQIAGSEEVAKFRHEHQHRVRFHKWLQWLAAGQLAETQRRARDAGMRIGLYLDLAVGVDPDGAATWSRPDSYAREARIGAPPDLFNKLGQDWGLAPLKPTSIEQGGGSAFSRDLASAMRFAGAVRLDHAMGLKRLYWIPGDFDARSGGYVRYPLERVLDVMAAQSQAAHALVIGEDLGTVPPGFRELMLAAGMLGYRVLYFEKEHDGRFRGPSAYTPLALACLSTHDLPPLAGWWAGTDIDERRRLGKLEPHEADASREERHREKSRLLEALAAEGLAHVPENAAESLTDDVIAALHRFLARTQSRLVAIQIEDLARAVEQVNMPGTHLEHRNWSLKLPLGVEEMAENPLVRSTLAAVASERPRSPS